MEKHLISLTLFIPFFGAIFQGLLSLQKSRWVAICSSCMASFLGIGMVFGMDPDSPGLHRLEVASWIGSYAIRYEMGLDGLNSLLVLLLSILFPILIGSEWKQAMGVKGIHGLFLILQTALFGTVFAQDLFLQFFFLGMTCFPVYFLIGIWGGKGREKAAFQFMVTAVLGFLLCFMALILVYYSVDPHTFSMQSWDSHRLVGKSFVLLGHSFSVSLVAFLLMSFGLSLRAPIWPFHGWFYEVIQEAPSSVGVALGSGLIPVVMYVFMKVCYLLFPELLATFNYWVMGVGLINLMMGAFCALAQRRLTGLLACLCLGQVGWILLGVASASEIGMVGAIYQLLVAGFSFASFGLMEGIIRERAGESTFMSETGDSVLGGIVTQAPLLSLFGGIAVASFLGLPGLGSFVSHSFILMGSFQLEPLMILVMSLFFLLTAYCLLVMYQTVFLGKFRGNQPVFFDLTPRERFYVLPLLVGLFFLGFYPKPWVALIRPAVLSLLSVTHSLP